MKIQTMMGLAVVGVAWAGSLSAQVNLTVDTGATWSGYMNVWELDANGGGYAFGSEWGAADLVAVMDAGTLTLGPNVNTYVDNPTDPFWVNQSTLEGNKKMDAAYYVEDTSLIGQTVNFSGDVVSNTLTGDYTAVAFVKVLDPGNGWSVVDSVSQPLVGGASFSLDLVIPDTAGLVPQYGFQTIGPNAPADHSFGSVAVTAVPEPSFYAFLSGFAVLGYVMYRRRRL